MKLPRSPGPSTARGSTHIRWNEPGLPIVYASETSSLALLETLVHTSVHFLPKSLVLVRIVIPDDASVREIRTTALHDGWRESGFPQCAAVGTQWLRAGESLVLRVPSATNPFEANILLNPRHAEMKRCKLGTASPLVFDPRLLSVFA